MAVASQTVRGALGAPVIQAAPRHDVIVRTTVAPRWAFPTVLLGTDALALTIAVLLVGVGSGVALAYAPLAILCLALSGAYRRRMSLRALDLTPWVIGRLARSRGWIEPNSPRSRRGRERNVSHVAFEGIDAPGGLSLRSDAYNGVQDDEEAKR